MSEEYYDDNPITDTDRDRLNRKGFAQTLAKSILNLQTNSTFTIGLYGAWGCGKTSIVNMIENEIKTLQSAIDEKEKLIIVHFEPWNFSNCDQLLSQFFVRLSNELKNTCKKNGRKDRILQNLGEALETYSDLFSLVETIPTFGKALSLILQSGAKSEGDKLQNEKDISAQKRSITDMLSKDGQKHNFLIIIDDVDRLSNDQIRQIFQLITSVANFPKMRYLVVFDKDIVIKALSKVQEGSGEAYLEKIIQMPIEVPKPSAAQLSNIMMQNLRTIYETYYHSTFDYALWKRSYEICCEPFIKSVRDINRICNSLSVKLSAIASEVNFMDMTALTTIQVVFPPIYDWIKRDKVNSIEHIIKKMHGKDDEPEITNEKIIGWLRYLGYPEEDFESITDKITACLAFLFPNWSIKSAVNYGKPYNEINAIKNNNICSSYKFDRYFSLDLDSITIKQSDILKIKDTFSVNEIIDVFKEHCNNDTISELAYVILSIKNDLTEERATIVFQAILDSFFTICFENSEENSKAYGAFDQFQILSYEMIKAIPQDNRLNFLNDIVSSDNFNRVISFMPAMRYIEIDHGRLESEYRRESVITESELNTIEQVLCRRVDGYITNHILYDITHWRMLVDTLNIIRPNYFDDFFNNSLNSADNILKYLGSYIVSYNNGAWYEVKEENYNRYLTNEQILNAITEQRNNKKFYTLPQDVQNASAAFYRNDQKMFERGEITCKGVKETLDAWKNEDGIGEQGDCNMV